MKIRFSFLYEMSPEEVAEKTKSIENVALGAIAFFSETMKKEYNENIERMRYSNMEAERRDKRWDRSKGFGWGKTGGFGGFGGLGGFGKTAYKTPDTTTNSADDPHDNGEPFEADGTRYGYSNPSDPDEQ